MRPDARASAAAARAEAPTSPMLAPTTPSKDATPEPASPEEEPAEASANDSTLTLNFWSAWLLTARQTGTPALQGSPRQAAATAIEEITVPAAQPSKTRAEPAVEAPTSPASSTAKHPPAPAPHRSAQVNVSPIQEISTIPGGSHHSSRYATTVPPSPPLRLNFDAASPTKSPHASPPSPADAGEPGGVGGLRGVATALLGGAAPSFIRHLSIGTFGSPRAADRATTRPRVPSIRSPEHTHAKSKPSRCRTRLLALDGHYARRGSAACLASLATHRRAGASPALQPESSQARSAGRHPATLGG
jgi:hypothetical protein